MLTAPAVAAGAPDTEEPPASLGSGLASSTGEQSKAGAPLGAAAAVADRRPLGATMHAAPPCMPSSKRRKEITRVREAVGGASLDAKPLSPVSCRKSNSRRERNERRDDWESACRKKDDTRGPVPRPRCRLPPPLSMCRLMWVPSFTISRKPRGTLPAHVDGTPVCTSCTLFSGVLVKHSAARPRARHCGTTSRSQRRRGTQWGGLSLPSRVSSHSKLWHSCTDRPEPS